MTLQPECRMPPHSVAAEHSVIGALLVGGADAFDRVADLLDDNALYLDSHRRIARHIRRLATASKPFDVVCVADSIHAANEDDQTGGLSYLIEIANSTASAADIRRHVEIINDKARRRQLIALADDVIGEAYTAETAVSVAAAASGRMLDLADSGRQSFGPMRIDHVLGRAIEQIETRIEKGEIFGLPTGFADLDRLTAGLHPGDLTIIAGRPSMGKTALAVNIAENVGMRGTQVLIFSLEMGAEQLAMRSIASVGGADLGGVRSGQMSDAQWDRVTNALGQLSDAPIWIDSGSSYTASQMLATARKLKRQSGLGLVVIDYLQLMQIEKDSGNKASDIGEITRRLKLMARTLDVPVLLLSQLSRKVEERTDKHPMMSDLRDSGAIEQDADVIMMVYRDEYYNPESTWKGFADVGIVKNRMGETGMVRLTFQGNLSRFGNADRGAVRDAEQAQQAKRSTPRRRVSMGDIA